MPNPRRSLESISFEMMQMKWLRWLGFEPRESYSSTRTKKCFFEAARFVKRFCFYKAEQLLHNTIEFLSWCIWRVAFLWLFSTCSFWLFSSVKKQYLVSWCEAFLHCAVFGELVRGGIYLDFLRCAVFGGLVRGIYLASDPVSFAPEPLLLADGAPPEPPSIQSLEYFTPECKVNNHL